MSNTPESSIAGPSRQNPDERPQEYTPISFLDNVSSQMYPPDRSVMSFSFQVRPAEKLRDFIETMYYDDGVDVAKIRASELGLEISIANFQETEWNNSFEMPGSDLMGFQYGIFTEKTEPQIVHLLPVPWVLTYIDKDDTLTIYTLNGSKNLSIMCEKSKPCSNLSFNFPSVNPLSLPHKRERGQQLNPPDDNIKSFSFQLRRAQVLKGGIRVLCDSRVNGLGLAYIHANDNGFQITVDSKDGCAGVLLFPADTLQNFQCYKPSTVAQVVNLAEVSWSLTPVDEEDTITVYQVDDQLLFMFEIDDVTILSIKVYNFPGFIGKFPQIETYCEGRVASWYLSWILRKCVMGSDDRCPVVLLEIEGDDVVFRSMDMGNWNDDYQRIMDSEKKKPRGQKYHAWFHCNFDTTLGLAAYEMLDEEEYSSEVEVRLSFVPERHVVFQFNHKGGGTLLILKRALAFYPDVDDIESLTTGLGRLKVTDLRN